MKCCSKSKKGFESKLRKDEDLKKVAKFERFRSLQRKTAVFHNIIHGEVKIDLNPVFSSRDQVSSIEPNQNLVKVSRNSGFSLIWDWQFEKFLQKHGFVWFLNTIRGLSHSFEESWRPSVFVLRILVYSCYPFLVSICSVHCKRNISSFFSSVRVFFSLSNLHDLVTTECSIIWSFS